MTKYGKDDPGRFISGALTGGSGPSDCIVKKGVGRGQTINSAYMLDNVGEIAGPHLDHTMGYDLKDSGVSHSLGTSLGKVPGGQG